MSNGFKLPKSLIDFHIKSGAWASTVWRDDLLLSSVSNSFEPQVKMYWSPSYVYAILQFSVSYCSSRGCAAFPYRQWRDRHLREPVCPNGSRRSCAIVQANHGITTKFVIEIARPDDWSISTLLLHPTQQTSLKTVKRDIKLLLEGLVQKGGHWDQNILNQWNGFTIDMVEHYQRDSIRGWAYRITGKYQTVEKVLFE